MRRVKAALINGGVFKDARGEIRFNNDFDLSPVKRMYFVSNSETKPGRGWQGHRIEQRWFICSKGRFTIHLIDISEYENPPRDLKTEVFEINDIQPDVLHVPDGYLSFVFSNSPDSLLIALSDYRIGEISDEVRFDADYFQLLNIK